MVATNPGLFTQSKPEDRRVVPDDPNGRVVFKVVYVVLESQYQASLTTACKRINAGQVGLHLCMVLAGCTLTLIRTPPLNLRHVLFLTQQASWKGPTTHMLSL
eukprot:6187769-Pleurochrysis_carterae.AAC.2